MLNLLGDAYLASEQQEDENFDRHMPQGSSKEVCLSVDSDAIEWTPHREPSSQLLVFRKSAKYLKKSHLLGIVR